MPRRKTYTKVEKENQIRADHVKGMGDVVFKGFQCLNPECQNFIFIKADEIYENFEIECSSCKSILADGEETKFYDYELVNTENNTLIEGGEFTVFHDDYLAEAQEYKYCIICNTLKPLYLFDRHGVRSSGRQSECRLCKGIYNNIKNQTRLTDQHREAAQKRRLYIELSGGEKIDSKKVYERFGYKCFKCGKDLSNVTDQRERPLDHTLPAYYLWALTAENTTLLCRRHNGEKSGKWTSEYYSDLEIKRLSVLTGLPYELLAGKPNYNPEALERLKDSQIVDGLLTKYSAYMSEIIKLRNRLLRDIDFDFFKFSKNISPVWIQKADAEL